MADLLKFTTDELMQASRKESIMQEAAQQIIKDFAEFSLEVNFSGDVSDFYGELYSQMNDHVRQLMSESSSRFQAMLYRIDINHRDITSYHRQAPNAPYEDILTELIIHREIKKVMIRDYFRTHSPNKQSDELDDSTE